MSLLSSSISEQIFQIDPLIRFVGIYRNNELYCSYRKDIKPYIDEKKTTQSLKQASKRWKERKELLSSGIGDPIYSVTMYGLVKRIVMELKDGSIILLSTEHEVDHEKLLLKLMDFRDL
ncbi:MAG: hypothetical protein ISR80_03960 [Nitrosopumilus sp.]|nr:hypothetical protein [Nitrosopumilus sp.]MDC4231743.1 hypothetical protein [Nitrosopumilus sp.]